jgi:hypothetical protein
MRGKPAVWIVKAQSASAESFQPVLWGLEEEGIPFEVQEVSDGPLAELAKRAADSSPLNVGISVGGRGEVILHHQNLPVETPLFNVSTGVGRLVRLRHLGINAARLVKGQPLVLGDEGTSIASRAASPGDSRDELADLVNLILNEMRK